MEQANEIIKRIKVWTEQVKELDENRRQEGLNTITASLDSKLEGGSSGFQDNLEEIKARFPSLFYYYCAAINEAIIKIAQDAKEGKERQVSEDLDSLAKLLFLLDLGMSLVIDVMGTPQEKEKEFLEKLLIEYELANYFLQNRKEALIFYLTSFDRNSHQLKLEKRLKGQ